MGRRCILGGMTGSRTVLLLYLFPMSVRVTYITLVLYVEIKTFGDSKSQIDSGDPIMWIRFRKLKGGVKKQSISNPRIGLKCS